MVDSPADLLRGHSGPAAIISEDAGLAARLALLARGALFYSLLDGPKRFAVVSLNRRQLQGETCAA